MNLRYFGRAKDLPGVKEMFTRGGQFCLFLLFGSVDMSVVAEANEESARNASFQRFRNQGPAYYGDEDELDAALLEEEEDLARQGMRNVLLSVMLMTNRVGSSSSRDCRYIIPCRGSCLASLPCSYQTGSLRRTS